MSNYSDPITATGSLISVQNRFGGLVDSLSVPISPVQDLHGYSKPWFGTEKNKYNPDANPFEQGGISSSNGQDSSTNYRIRTNGYTAVDAGTEYTLSTNLPHTYVFYYTSSNGYISSSGAWKSTPYTFTTPATAAYMRIVLAKSTSGSGTRVYPSDAEWMQIEKGGTATDFLQYANICSISGSTGVDVYVSPTQDVADATTYAADWTADAGTVYGGTVNLTTGELTVDRVIFETTWSAGSNATTYGDCTRKRFSFSDADDKSRKTEDLCNMATYITDDSADGWAAGSVFSIHNSNKLLYLSLPTSTPSTQTIQLCYYLATPVTYQLTAQDVALLIGQNYLWASNSEALTMIYRLWLKDRETGATSIGKNAESLTVTPQFNGVSKVVINITPELAYEAGNDTGRTITIDCPWGTQTMANNLLTMLEGFQYQPYEAENALLDPSAELGDGLTVNGVYGGIFKMTVRSGVLHAVDVSSPQDEEIDHEYPFVASSERKIERQLANVKSELSVQADQISAKVDREGGDPSSVSWEMNADQFKILSDGTEVLIIDDNGLTVNGDGNFTGDVHAGNIKYGGSSGTFSGKGISGGSIGTSKVDTDINTQLANAQYAASVFAGSVRASWGKFGQLDASYFKFVNKTISLVNYNSLDGSYKVLCTNQN